MKHAFLDVPDTSPTFYALCAVLLLELMALGPLERYVNKPETLPATVVPCQHVSVDTNGVIYAYGYHAGLTVTNVTQAYWYGATNRP